MDLGDTHLVITGANTGLGRATALQLADRGARLTLACRSRAKTEPVLAELAARGVRADFLALDLGDLASVRRAAAELLARNQPIQVLVNNAGLAAQRGHTVDGFEICFGTNHLGHYLWTRLLMPRVLASGPGRIVILASERHRSVAAPFDWRRAQEGTGSRFALQEYGLSKLANILFQRSLTRRLEGTAITTYALNPGKVATDVTRGLPRWAHWFAQRIQRSAEDCARYTIDCAVAPELAAHTGRYYDQGREKPVSRLGADDALAEELWQRSAVWVGLPAEDDWTTRRA